MVAERLLRTKGDRQKIFNWMYTCFDFAVSTPTMVTFEVFYEGLTQANWYRNSLPYGRWSDRALKDIWKDVAEALWEWSRRNKPLKVVVTLHYRAQQQQQQDDTERTPRPSGGRSTATSRALARADDTEQGLEDEGNFAAKLHLKWQCKLRSCRNNTLEGVGLCFVNGRDSPENHLPLYGPNLVAWAAAIREGEADETMPPVSVAIAMKEAKDNGRTALGVLGGGRQRQQQQTTPVSITQHFSSGPSPRRQHESPQPEHRELSPLMSSQASPDEHMESLFSFLKGLPSWRKESQELQEMEATLQEDRWDILGLEKMAETRWIAYRFRIGQFERLKAGIRKWKAQRPSSRR